MGREHTRRPRKGGVRLTGGELRGRIVAVPGDARPTEGRVREALFSIWRERLDGGRVLDLFAGSGVVALEAASRGALSAVAVEMAPRSVTAIEQNVRRTGMEGVVAVRRGTLPGDLARLAPLGPFDLVYADPPYRYPDYAPLLAAVEPLLAADGEVAVEHSSRHELPVEVAGLVRVDVRRYGESGLSFYRRAPR
ncbi:MAG TPA: 16S rRNA (guanine(966)-N(2))-methyltransferase RsmD [Thermoanaerobaculia bacterium]|nr:16S rRNA (guanine(966)-N(2))-methyltransferase RsmD [Thermoanaerobaculia bacterium]